MRSVMYLWLLLSPLAAGQRADFFKEDITFRLDRKYLRVEGYYWFANPSAAPLHREVYYPFPAYAGDQIDSIRIYGISAGREIGFDREEKYGLSFVLHVGALDTALVQIKYRQRLGADSAVYILKTTQGWGKPLQEAEFKLITSDSFAVRSFSYPPDESYKLEAWRIYRWKRRNFMPSEDLIFHF